jgi:hypothetical protein
MPAHCSYTNKVCVCSFIYILFHIQSDCSPRLCIYKYVNICVCAMIKTKLQRSTCILHQPHTFQGRQKREPETRSISHLGEVISTSASTWRPFWESVRDAVPALSSHLSWSLSTKVTQHSMCTNGIWSGGW